MDLTNLNEKSLREGERFHFDNSEHCDRIQSDDLRGGFCDFNKRFQLFSIFFNGACIHTSRTFRAMKARLTKLTDKWHLEEITEEEACW